MVAGRWLYLYRAIDQFGQVIDVLISQKRDLSINKIRYVIEQVIATSKPGESCMPTIDAP
jgi:transposase-like protein